MLAPEGSLFALCFPERLQERPKFGAALIQDSLIDTCPCEHAENTIEGF